MPTEGGFDSAIEGQLGLETHVMHATVMLSHSASKASCACSTAAKPPQPSDCTSTAALQQAVCLRSTTDFIIHHKHTHALQCSIQLHRPALTAQQHTRCAECAAPPFYYCIPKAAVQSRTTPCHNSPISGTTLTGKTPGDEPHDDAGVKRQCTNGPHA